MSRDRVGLARPNQLGAPADIESTDEAANRQQSGAAGGAMGIAAVTSAVAAILAGFFQLARVRHVLRVFALHLHSCMH